jgi:hypothetical protein
MMTSAPLSTMSELTRQNLEVWTRMQESMFAAFTPPREAPKTNGKDADADDVPKT